MKANFTVPQEQLADYCRRWDIVELSLFGSALREDFRPDSDVDILVSFREDARHTLFTMVRMQEELKCLIGRKVDLLSRRGLEKSKNYLRKKAIFDTAEVLYEA